MQTRAPLLVRRRHRPVEILPFDEPLPEEIVHFGDGLVPVELKRLSVDRQEHSHGLPPAPRDGQSNIPGHPNGRRETDALTRAKVNEIAEQTLAECLPPQKRSAGDRRRCAFRARSERVEAA